jgi:hypothetical protein
MLQHFKALSKKRLRFGSVASITLEIVEKTLSGSPGLAGDGQFMI